MKKEKSKKTKLLRDFYAVKILSDEDTRDFLFYVISQVTGLDIDYLKEKFHLASTRVGQAEITKNAVCDVILTSEDGDISIEVNFDNPKKLTEYKNKTYIASIILKRMNPTDGMQYSLIRDVTQINLNSFDIYGDGEFIHKGTLKNEKGEERRYNILTIYDINLEYLSKISYTNIDKLDVSKLEKRLYFLTHSDFQDLDELYEGDDVMDKVMKKLKKLSVESLDAYLEYDPEELAKEGNYLEGYDKGKEEGREEGREETRIENAKSLMKNGVDKSIIIKSLNLTETEIKELFE